MFDNDITIYKNVALNSVISFSTCGNFIAPDVNLLPTLKSTRLIVFMPQFKKSKDTLLSRDLGESIKFLCPRMHVSMFYHSSY